MTKIGPDVDDELGHALKVAAAWRRVSQRQILEEALAAHPSIQAALESIKAAPRDAAKTRKA